MKIRTGLVTNSGSSGFIIARKGELSEHMKEIIVDFVLKNMLGKKMLSPDSTDEDTKRKRIFSVFDPETGRYMRTGIIREGIW